VEVNGVVYTEGDGNLVDNGDDTWTLTIPDSDALPEGIYDVVATVTDTAGNTAQDATIDELRIDFTITLPTVDPQDTQDSTPTITGTADSSDVLTVEVNGVVYTEGDGNLVDNGDDTWTLTIPDGDALPEGIYDVIATVTDASGNRLSDATTDELEIMAFVSDLIITKGVDRSDPLVGENVTFTIEVRNNGGTNFVNVVILEPLRSGFSYVNATVTHGGYDRAAGIWNIDNLLANETAILTLEAKVGAVGDFTNTASIESSDPTDLDPDNNTAEVTVELNCLTVFNEFTPNNDGANDTFRIACIEKYPNSTLQIFNRYGSPVYKAKGYRNDWNGFANVGGVVGKGQPLPEGNYYYLLTIDELGKTLTGWIYLAR
ncbi:MAG TPA: gliding motility-associated C-terminal domain-containing protein, partial [Arenibacter sp.]|nr:gliding motility-associated C-terminal domain-containing protein [Arenibacter sp.]